MNDNTKSSETRIMCAVKLLYKFNLFITSKTLQVDRNDLSSNRWACFTIGFFFIDLCEVVDPG